MGVWRRAKPEVGIYDEIISGRVDDQLRELDATYEVVRHEIGKSENVSDALAVMLRDALNLAISDLGGQPRKALSLAEDVLAVLRRYSSEVFEAEGEVRLRPERLRAVLNRPETEPRRPRGSLHSSSLIVNAEGENLLDHLSSEFDSADRVDLLCAFVKLSGFDKFRRAIERHSVERGRPLRVLTTTYMGATDAKAIQRLALLPNVEVKISYNDQITRLHAKAWVFHRLSGLSTGYVGSSNLSHAAQTDGLEWNVRLTESDQPALLTQMRETFDQYWEDEYQFESFDPLTEAHRLKLQKALSGNVRDFVNGFLPELTAKDFQRPILDELREARRLGRHKNLLVAATGTGKTVMAALDYAELKQAGAVDTLLFVAHRREILEKSRETFRSALQQQTFGELLFQGARPEIGRHVFASIDSLGEGSPIDPASFDMVILDEAHHSAADTWQALLGRVQSKELLGLTGTPERADGLDYESFFPRPWVGELRVWKAIPHALVPFRYFMLDVEGVDLRDVAWTGHYASKELSGRLIGAAEVFVRRACEALAEHVARPDDLRAIAFCVDVRHAEEICSRLIVKGFRAAVLTGGTPSQVRRNARLELDSGSTQILCVVDIYNEGVDVPNVNTLFFFRPTESATVFLQQLGRGLRRTVGKAELVVFDLTCRQRLEFRFDRRLRALLGHTPNELHQLVATSFGRLPAGCHLHFDEVARQEVLAQIRRAIPDNLRGIRELLREPQNCQLTLEEFLRETDVAIEDIYRRGRSWTTLRHDVGLDGRAYADGEEAAVANLHKLLHVGDEERLEQWGKLVECEYPGTERERRIQRMLFGVIYGADFEADGTADQQWPLHNLLREELREMIPILRAKNGVLAEPDRLSADVPLRLHARYLAVEMSAAFDRRADGRLRGFISGVEPVAEKAYDVLTVTVHKAEATKEHLRYRDFPLNLHEFNWQSKARTTLDSREGRRHLNPDKEGCTPLLFVRERDDERPGVTMGFRYLGPVSPISHEGERPITVKWRLQYAMPTDLLQSCRIAA